MRGFGGWVDGIMHEKRGLMLISRVKIDGVIKVMFKKKGFAASDSNSEGGTNFHEAASCCCGSIECDLRRCSEQRC